MPPDPTKKRHTLEDHLLGLDPLHSHDEGEADHDHDHDDVGGEYDPTASSLWAQDNIELVSVGIDIGSAGTQVIFSRVQLRRLAEELTSRYFVVERETVYQSPVALTPYVSEERIDDNAVGGIIDAAYEAAGFHPDNIDTGAVILTGEALRRENAKATCSRKSVVNSCAPPRGITWNRCLRRTVLARRRPHTIAAYRF
jgi:ethanolamine utilization protein EutA